MLKAYIGVSQARASALTDAGMAVPAIQPITALADTGASGTCVDPSVLQQLGLVPTGKVQVHTPSTGSQPHVADQYDVSIWIPGATAEHPPFHLENLPVLRCELLRNQGFHALIGRDILSVCLLAYNGMATHFTFAY